MDPHIQQAEECKLNLKELGDERLLNLLSVYGDYLGVSYEFILFPLLSCVSALMGKSSCEISECWEEPSTLWTVVGSQSGTRKSAVIDHFSINLENAWHSLVEEANEEEFPKNLPLILEPISVSKYDKCGTFGLALAEDTNVFMKSFKEKGDLRLKRLYDSSYNPKYKWQRPLCIGGFLHHYDMENFLVGEDADINYRFLLTCPTRPLYRFIDLKHSLALDDPKISDLFVTIGRVHFREKYYCMSSETSKYFGELCDEFTVAMESTTDELICNILSKCHGQIIRVASVISCVKQGLKEVYDKIEKAAKAEAQKEEAEREALKPKGKKRGRKPSKGATPAKKQKKSKDSDPDSSDPEFTANVSKDIQDTAVSDRPARATKVKSYDFQDLLLNEGIINDNGLEDVLDDLDDDPDYPDHDFVNKTVEPEPDWSTEIEKSDLKAAYVIVKHSVCVRLSLLDLTLYGFRNPKPVPKPAKTPVKSPAPQKLVRQNSNSGMVAAPQPKRIMVPQQQQATQRQPQQQAQFQPRQTVQRPRQATQQVQYVQQGQNIQQRQMAQLQQAAKQGQMIRQGQINGQQQMARARMQQVNNNSPRQMAANPNPFMNASPRQINASPRQMSVSPRQMNVSPRQSVQKSPAQQRQQQYVAQMQQAQMRQRTVQQQINDVNWQ